MREQVRYHRDGIRPGDCQRPRIVGRDAADGYHRHAQAFRLCKQRHIGTPRIRQT